MWWISILCYLWRNSLQRWIEQPLGVLSKLLIAALIGLLGALLVISSSFLGRELEKRMNDREVRLVSITEIVGQAKAAGSLDEENTETELWRDFGDDAVVIYRLPSQIRIEARTDIPLIAVHDPESHGYPDSISFVSRTRPPGSSVEVQLDSVRVLAFVHEPSDLLWEATGRREHVLGSVDKFAPLMVRGFGKTVVLRAASLAKMEHLHLLEGVLRRVENRQVTVTSGLDILKEIEAVRDVQRLVLWAATVGSALVLGLVVGALAWMEFREERYLLALIRSFGVGRLMLFFHAVVENCLMAVLGVLMGFGILSVVSQSGRLRAMENMEWLTDMSPLWGTEGMILLAGAVLGGILSCVPVGIGLRKPLGLVLK